jgi:Arc/MetJ-type ribon-helix-helix transcriptional regulator
MSVSVPTKLEPQLLRELDRLVDEGLYVSRSEAIRDAVRRLVAERYMSATQHLRAMASVISEVIQMRFGRVVENIILFGSVAKGSANPDSDIDLLILTKDLPEVSISRLSTRIHEVVYPIMLASGTVATMVVLGKDSFLRMLKEGSHFAREVVETGVQLKGALMDEHRS